MLLNQDGSTALLNVGAHVPCRETEKIGILRGLVEAKLLLNVLVLACLVFLLMQPPFLLVYFIGNVLKLSIGKKLAIDQPSLKVPACFVSTI